MGSHSVTCHPAEVTFPPLPQPKLVLDLATPEGCKAELTCKAAVRAGKHTTIDVDQRCEFAARNSLPVMLCRLNTATVGLLLLLLLLLLLILVLLFITPKQHSIQRKHKT